MSATTLSPLKLIVSHNSEGRWSGSGSTRYNSNSTTGSAQDSTSTELRLRSRTQSWLPSLAPAHLQMEEDPHDFYLGDIYARISRPFDCFLRTQAEQEETAGRYHEHIRKICRGWHHLRYLADFMTVGTVPLRCKNLTAEERDERLNRVNISIVEYGDEMSSNELKSPDELDEFLADVSVEEKRPQGRLLIVQDLSTCMIEKLGAAFDVEPWFFRAHIGDYVWLNTRDPQAEIPSLEAFSTSSNAFSIQYVQPRYFETKESLKKAKVQTDSFNVLRRIDHDGRFKPWSDIAGSDVGLVRSKASLWVRPNRPEQEGWLGILLVDPSVTHGLPLWSGYGNFHPPPSVDTPLEDISFPPYDGSIAQEIVFWTQNQAISKAKVTPPSPELLPLAFFTMVCAQWLIMCEYVNTRLGQIEWEIELGLSNLYAQDFDHTLKTLLIWRRRMPIYHAFVERSISRISARYKSSSDTKPFNSWQDVLTNLGDILHRLEILHCRADKIMAVSMAVTAREESKKATQESRAITRVSYLAFVFVPLSFWTSFFSMSGEFPLTTYWIYAAIALPISACAFCALVFAGNISRLWRRMRGREDRDSGMNEKGKGRWNSGV